MVAFTHKEPKGFNLTERFCHLSWILSPDVKEWERKSGRKERRRKGKRYIFI